MSELLKVLRSQLDFEKVLKISTMGMIRPDKLCRFKKGCTSYNKGKKFNWDNECDKKNEVSPSYVRLKKNQYDEISQDPSDTISNNVESATKLSKLLRPKLQSSLSLETGAYSTKNERECKPAYTPLKLSYFHGVCNVPLSPLTVGQILEKASASDPDRIIFRCPEFQETIKLAELKQKADEISRSFIKLGLKKGDIVMVIGVANIDYFILFFATLSIGLQFYYPFIQGPPYNGFTKLLKVNPAVILIGMSIEPKLLPYLEKVIAMPSDYGVTKPKIIASFDMELNGCQSFGNLKNEGLSISYEHLLERKSIVSNDDSAIIVTTSGTTGENKSPCSSHHVLVNHAKFSYTRVHQCSEGDIIGIINPILDDMLPAMTAVECIYNWKKMEGVLSPTSIAGDFRVQDPRHLMKFIQDERITLYAGYAYQWVAMVKSPEFKSYDLTSLRRGQLLAQRVTPEMRERLTKYFPDIVVVYGSTESPGVLKTSVVYSGSYRRLHCVGYPLPHSEVKIIGREGEILPIGEKGEICVRGWGSFLCYVNEPKKTSETKGNDGWIHMGDIGIMDESGHVFFEGRKEDCVMFKHSADKVFPITIINAAKDLPYVDEVKVIGIPNDEKGDDICVFMTLKEKIHEAENEISNYFEEKLVDKDRPDFIFILDNLPRVGSRNKVHLQRLREIALERTRLHV